MDITAGSLIGMAKLIGEWIKSGVSSSSANKYDLFEALHSVQDALTVTRSCISRMNRSGERDWAKEEVISKLWNSASKDLRKVDEHALADKCSLKGYYWASPENWNNDETKDAEIEVTQVFNDVQTLLAEYT